MKRYFDGLYAGWTFNPRSVHPVSHAMTVFGGGTMTLACGVPSGAMDHTGALAEPNGAPCAICAEYVRVQLLSRVVELACARTAVTGPDAQAMLAQLAERAKGVVS